jgi:hypothetical protein
MAKKSKKVAKTTKKKTPKMVEKPHRAVRLALKDVFGRAPKKMSLHIETERPLDDDGGWSGNIYKYTF